MSEAVQFYLRQFVDGIESDNREKTLKASYGLLQSFEATVPDERVLLKQTATKADDPRLSDDRRTELTKILSTATNASISRNSFLISLALYLDERLPEETILKEARQLIETEESFSQDLDEAKRETRNVETGPSLEIASTNTPTEPVYPDESFELKIKLVNRGDATATDVVIAVSTGGAVSLSPPVLEVGDVDPDVSGIATFEVTGHSPGIYTVIVDTYEVNGEAEDKESVLIDISEEGNAFSIDQDEDLDDLGPLLGEIGLLGGVLGWNELRNRSSDEEEGDDSGE